jgi:hypothetical protein
LCRYASDDSYAAGKKGGKKGGKGGKGKGGKEPKIAAKDAAASAAGPEFLDDDHRLLLRRWGCVQAESS